MSNDLRFNKNISLGVLNEKKEILSEWSAEINRSLESLRSERSKVDRHIRHLQNRVFFLEASIESSNVKEDSITLMKSLQSDLSQLNVEIEAKEKLFKHIQNG